MSEPDTPRRPGPWDPKSGPVAPAPVTAAPAAPRSGEVVPDKGQPPLTALVSTLLLGGLIWVLTQSWMIALAVVIGVFVHEYGHVLAMNRVGIGPARIHIVPFFGGLARAQRQPDSEWDGVIISLAGPVFGLLAAVPFFVLYVVLGDPAWLVGAGTIAALNLVNLLPAPPLDGSKALGPVLARIHPNLERAAMIVVAGLALYWGVVTGRWLLVVFLGIALLGHLRRGHWRPEGRPLTARESAMSVGLFLASATLCAAVGVAALMPVSDGTLGGALYIGARELGLAE